MSDEPTQPEDQGTPQGSDTPAEDTSQPKDTPPSGDTSPGSDLPSSSESVTPGEAPKKQWYDFIIPADHPNKHANRVAAHRGGQPSDAEGPDATARTPDSSNTPARAKPDSAGGAPERPGISIWIVAAVLFFGWWLFVSPSPDGAVPGPATDPTEESTQADDDAEPAGPTVAELRQAGYANLDRAACTDAPAVVVMCSYEAAELTVQFVWEADFDRDGNQAFPTEVTRVLLHRVDDAITSSSAEWTWQRALRAMDAFEASAS